MNLKVICSITLVICSAPFSWSNPKAKRTEQLSAQPLVSPTSNNGTLPTPHALPTTAGSPNSTLKLLPSSGAAAGPAAQLPMIPLASNTLINPLANPNTALGMQAMLPYLIQLFANSGSGTQSNPFSTVPGAQTDYKNFGNEELDLAKDTLSRIDQIQQATRGAGIPPEFVNTPELPGCTECSRAANKNPRFESCTEKNGYFEDFLTTINNPKLQVLNDHQPSSSTVTCISESIRESTDDRYVYCPKGNRPYLGTVSKPCASEKLVKTVASAFELTTECLADYVDPVLGQNEAQKNQFQRSMYQLINHESRFVVNGKSHTGAGGLGQLVGGLIKDVNRNEFSALQAHIKNSKNQACLKLAGQKYEPMQEGNSEVAGCDRMALEHGPQLNLMYTMAHMKMIRDQIRDTVNEIGIQDPEKSHLMNQVALWGHNVGSSGIAQSFQLAVARNGALLKGETPNVNEFLKRMSQDVQRWHLQNSRRNAAEPTAFLFKTFGDLARIEQKANGKCGSSN